MDEVENIIRAKTDADYLGDVVIANESLIWHAVYKYVGSPKYITRNGGLEKDDILQLGRLGFIKAVYAFDINRGVKFSSFSVTAIFREVRCFLRDSSSIIRPTRTANSLINRLRSLELKLGYLPHTSELSVLLDEDESKIIKALLVGQNIKYLDEPVKSKIEFLEIPISMTDNLLSDIDEDTILDEVYLNNITEKLAQKLTDVEMEVFKNRLSGLNQTQTAKKQNISQMRVSRITRKIAKLIREEM